MRLAPISSSLFLAALLLAAVETGAQTVTRGPYLQVSAPTRITVRWRTSVATTSRVRYGPAPDALTLQADAPVATTEHRVVLTGLAPATRYYYSIGSTSAVLQGDATHVFDTPPPAGTRAPVRVWAFGDGGTGTAEQIAVRNGFQSFAGGRRADVWLLLGDNAYDWGTDASYQSRVFATYPTLLRTSPVWVTRGNHDLVYPGDHNDLLELFDYPAAAEAGGLASGSEAYWSFDHANVHFIGLDSEATSRVPAGPMMTWLAADLAATNQEWVIAFWHHPPYTKGSHDSDNLNDSGGRMAQMRDWALPILESAGVDLVLAGHSHTYERSCLLDGHYGPSSNLDDSNRIDAGDGRTGGDGPYVKPTAGKAPHEGAVYVVAGSAGETAHSPPPRLDHPAIVVGLNELGSFVVDVDGLRLDGRFVGAAGAVLDSFTILKGAVAGAPPPRSGLGLALEVARPNPSRAETRITYHVPAPGEARLAIYDLGGRRVLERRAEHAAAGRHEFMWHGADLAGRRVTPGVYVVELRYGAERRMGRLVRVD